MRTTIEMKAEHREALLQLAGRRGAKGFSALVAEALDVYLKAAKADEAKRRVALALRGTFRPAEAEVLRTATRAIRERWR